MEARAMKELDYGISVATGAFIEALGMHAENQDRVQRGQSVAYVHDDFRELAEERGLHHNSVLARWADLPI